MVGIFTNSHHKFHKSSKISKVFKNFKNFQIFLKFSKISKFSKNFQNFQKFWKVPKKELLELLKILWLSDSKVVPRGNKKNRKKWRIDSDPSKKVAVKTKVIPWERSFEGGRSKNYVIHFWTTLYITVNPN